MKFTYEATYEDCSPDGTVRVSAEVRFTYTVIWGCPARIHYDEHDHPAEGDELEISKVEIEYLPITSSPRLAWRNATTDESDFLSVWAESLYEEMILDAREQEAGAEEEAKEHAAEARAELRRMEE